MPSLNQCYNDVATNAGVFRNALVNLHSVLSTEAPVLYIVTTDKKQFWFIECEDVSLNTDGVGPYSISIKGRGVRAYFSEAVDMGFFVNAIDTKANPSNDEYVPTFPKTNNDMLDMGMGSLTRYEVFGALLNYTPQKMSISDLIRNNTVGDSDDYLIGKIANKHFVGNFAKTASYIVGSNLEPVY